MNVVTAPNPLAVSGCQIPYFNDVSSWLDSFDESLSPTGKSLLGGGGGGEEGGGYDGMQFFKSTVTAEFTSDYLPEWLADPIPLPSPEEQVVFSPESSPFPSPHSSPQSSLVDHYALLTPDSSHPSSPHSACYYSDDPDVNDVMCSLLDNDEPYQFSPNAALPVVASPFEPPSLAPETAFGSTEGSNMYQLPDPLPVPELETPPTPPEAHAAKTPSPSHGSTSMYQLPDLVPIPKTDPPTLPKARPAKTPSSSRKRKASSSGRRSQSVRKERKRQQNKSAALRYRQRKKGEKMDIEERRSELEKHNEVLRSEVDAMTTEIQYLKHLWQEVCEAKRRQLR